MMVSFGVILKILFMLLFDQNEMQCRAKTKIQMYVCGNYQSVMKIIDVNPF